MLGRWNRTWGRVKLCTPTGVTPDKGVRDDPTRISRNLGEPDARLALSYSLALDGLKYTSNDGKLAPRPKFDAGGQRTSSDKMSAFWASVRTGLCWVVVSRSGITTVVWVPCGQNSSSRRRRFFTPRHLQAPRLTPIAESGFDELSARSDHTLGKQPSHRQILPSVPNEDRHNLLTAHRIRVC